MTDGSEEREGSEQTAAREAPATSSSRAARSEPQRATQSEAISTDQLPEDLDVTAYVGPYTFPDNRRRLAPGAIYGVTGVALIVLYAARGDAVLVNEGFLVGGLVLLALAAYHVAAAWSLKVDETEALAAAGREAGFAVGHASAQLGWRGLLSRPTWRILLYSAEDPPSQRGFVLVDAVDGEIVGRHVEANPEDWSEFGRRS